MGYTLHIRITKDSEIPDRQKWSIFGWVKKTNKQLSHRSEKLWLSPIDGDYGFSSLIKPGDDEDVDTIVDAASKLRDRFPDLIIDIDDDFGHNLLPVVARPAATKGSRTVCTAEAEPTPTWTPLEPVTLTSDYYRRPEDAPTVPSVSDLEILKGGHSFSIGMFRSTMPVTMAADVLVRWYDADGTCLGQRQDTQYTDHLSNPNWDTDCGVSHYTPLPSEAAGKRWEFEIRFAGEQTLDTPVQCEKKGTNWYFSADPPIKDYVIYGLHVRWLDKEGNPMSDDFLTPWEQGRYVPGPIELEKRFPKATSVEARLVGGRLNETPQRITKPPRIGV